MNTVRKITDEVFYIGGSDRRLSLFENVYPIPEGVSYNSYLLKDEKNVLLDTVDESIADRFLENLAAALDGAALDYVVVNHMEPDHSATLVRVLRAYPDAKIVCTAKALTMMKQYFSEFKFDERSMTVKEGDELTTGRHTLTFAMAPMVHWPEVMLTFDKTDGTLYSADAFGTFGALSGNLFADEYDFEKDWLESARRYYTNIVGKYGPQTGNALKKAAKLDIKRICPLHGPIWRENIGWFIDKYTKWATYTPEESSVLIVYGSIYGHTANAADLMADELAERGIRNIAEFDVSKTDPSYLVAETFRRSHLVIATATYNACIFTKMEQYLLELKEHNMQNRTVAIIENGTWAPQAGKQVRAMLEGWKNMTILDPQVTIKSAIKDEQREQIKTLADAVADSVRKLQNN